MREFPLDSIEESKTSLLSAHEDSVPAKLRREAHVLLHGLSEGLRDHAESKINNPLGTSLQLGFAYGFGYGLASIQSGSRIGKVAGQVAAVGMLAAFAKDVGGQASELGSVIGDTWRSSKTIEENKKIVAQTLAPFVLDSFLFGIAGTLGAHAPQAKLSLKHRVESDESLSKSLIKMELPGGAHGSGFVIKDGRVVSAMHVVENETTAFNSARTLGNEKISIAPEIAFPQHDLVLYRINNEVDRAKVLPMTLAETSSNLGRSTPVSAAGFVTREGSEGLHLRVGASSGARRGTVTGVLSPEDIKINIDVVRYGDTRPGMSGGPVLNEQMEVVALNKAAAPYIFLRPFISSVGTKVEDIHSAVAIARNKDQLPSLSIEQALSKFGMTESEIVIGIYKGEIKGYQIPIAAANLKAANLSAEGTLPPNSLDTPVNWQWRILDRN